MTLNLKPFVRLGYASYKLLLLLEVDQSLQKMMVKRNDFLAGKFFRQQEETRQTLLTQILDNEARERLARISIVKAEKARTVEDLLIRMAQSGQLRGKVSESQLIDLLQQINQQQKPEKKIVYNRRKFEEDSD
ncbi:DNA-binding TFAR19-related protein [Gigaspora margarita]|uniref:DNA-binding TFAR19-related protein n=1 Tax=Gigaspora margarita TaxID=4874 RepID=A0A8H4AAP0_GIGMA|nr:DNA-binding TFAR19-related protein [Gigaspora margarita]